MYYAVMCEQLSNQKDHRKLSPSFIQSNALLKSSIMVKIAESRSAETEFALGVPAKAEIKVIM